MRPKEEQPLPKGSSMSRRSALGTIGGGLSAVYVALRGDPRPARAEGQNAPTEQQIIDQTNKLKEAAKQFSVDDIAYRISNAYVYKDMWHMAFQGAIIQDNPSLGVVLANSMDELHEKGLDSTLDAFYQIPPQEDFDDNAVDTNDSFLKRVAHFQWPQRIANWFSEKRARFETGVPVAKAKDYGPFTSFRTQRYVGQLWSDGRIERILVGDVVKNVGRTMSGKTIPGDKIIPDSALLPEPEVIPSVPTGVTNPPIEPPRTNNSLEFPVVQQGRGQQTSWETQKAPNSPITPTVLRPDALTKATDTWLPKKGITGIKFKYLPIFDGYNYPGVQREFDGGTSRLTDTPGGPSFVYKYSREIVGNQFVIYYAPRDAENLTKIRSATPEMLDKFGRNFSHLVGNLIAEAGGFNLFSGPTVPESRAMSDENLPPTIRLAFS